MTGALRGAAALVASFAFHVGIAGVFALNLVPQRPPDQSLHETQLNLATYEVKRTEATQAEAQGDAAREGNADSLALGPGAIAQDRAEPVAPALDGIPTVAPISGSAVALLARETSGDRTPPALPEAKAVKSASLSASPVAAAVAQMVPADEAKATLTPAAESLVKGAALAILELTASAVNDEPIALVSLTLQAGEVTGTRMPVTEPEIQAANLTSPAPVLASAVRVQTAAVGQAKATPTSVPESLAEGELAITPEPPGDQASEARPSVSSAVDVPPQANVVTAALAWSGEGDAEIDSISLAAIQSFMRAGDVPGDAEDEVRDGIGALLATVPCARLQTVFDPDTGALELRGHVPEEGLRQPVLAALRAKIGKAVPVSDNVLVLPRPQCTALSGIASVGLPQSDEQDRNPRVVGANAHARVYDFTEGERLMFDLQGPDYESYFFVDYFDADGMVLHLQPNEFVPLTLLRPKDQVVIGAMRSDVPALDIRVTPPFGQEIMVAFAASRPLFDTLRPLQEPADLYLEALRAAIHTARSKDPVFKGEWVYFFVETRSF